MLQDKLIGLSFVVAGLVVVAAAASCGGTVVFEEDGGDGGNGNGSTATVSNANANAGTAGPGGVGGADGVSPSPPSSSGVGGPGCVYHERSTTYCYTHDPCHDDHVRETECELGPADVRQCWCFQDGAFIAQCEVTSEYCVSALAECCEALWP